LHHDPASPIEVVGWGEACGHFAEISGEDGFIRSRKAAV
jgi:hypothetical protein